MTTTTHHETTAARLLLGCADRLAECGMPADAVARAAFAAAFQCGYRCAAPAAVYAQLRACLDELEQCDSEGGTVD